MTASIIGQAATANTTRVAAALPPQTAARAAAPKAAALPNAALLTQAYHVDKGASKLSNYKSYDEDGQPRLFFQDGSPANGQPRQTGDAQKAQYMPAANGQPQQTGDAQKAQNGPAATGQPQQTEAAEKAGMEPVTCETCANRKYQDVSDDAGVSFQTATHVSSQASFSAVSRHEREHVTRETRDAEQNGQKAITSVRIFMDRCPECGKWYASGGLTKVTKISTGDAAKDTSENAGENAGDKKSVAS